MTVKNEMENELNTILIHSYLKILSDPSLLIDYSDGKPLKRTVSEVIRDLKLLNGDDYLRELTEYMMSELKRLKGV